MRQARTVLIVILLIFIWAVLLAVTLKPVGIAHACHTFARTVFLTFFTPLELSFCGPGVPFNAMEWRWNNSVMSVGSKEADGARVPTVLFKAGDGLSSVRLENYDIGPGGIRDWTFFRMFTIAIDQEDREPLALKLKISDVSGRSFEKEIGILTGINRCVIDLEEAGRFIELQRVAGICIYTTGLARDRQVKIAEMRLVREEGAKKRVLDEPVLKLKTVLVTKKAERGGDVVVSALIATKVPLRGDYRLFVHIFPLENAGRGRGSPLFMVNADRDPWVPTSQWLVGREYDIGPITCHLPSHFPKGRYAVLAGFFNPFSTGRPDHDAAHSGMFDYRSSSPRLAYIEPRFADFVVETIDVS